MGDDRKGVGWGNDRRIKPLAEASPEEAAWGAVAALEKRWRLHWAEVQLESVAHDGRRGRPRLGAAPRRSAGAWWGGWWRPLRPSPQS